MMKSFFTAALLLFFVHGTNAAGGESQESAFLVMDGFDTNRDGKISIKELQDRVGDDPQVKAAFKGWQTGFLDADLDKDGQLDVVELASFLSHVNGQDQSKLVEESQVSLAASIMDGFDANKDGKISLKELRDSADVNSIKDDFEGWQSGFLEADVDKDGHLTIKELASLLNKVSRQDQHKLVEDSEWIVAESIMDGFDTNKDGHMSMKELLNRVGNDAEVQAAFKGWQTGFLDADANGDGLLSIDELAFLLKHVSRQDQHKLVEESEVSVAGSIMDGFDTNKDGKISMKELLNRVGDNAEVEAAFKGWQAGFLNADSDGDGYLSEEELASLLSQVSRKDQHHMVEESEATVAKSILSGFDINKDGKISLKELLENVHAADDEIEAAFKGWQAGFLNADSDHDGHLDEGELQSLLTQVSRHDQQKLVEENELRLASSIMDGFDSNKDGTISLKELLDHAGDRLMDAAFEGWQNGFMEADADKDGRLTVEELASLLNHVSTSDQQELAEQSEMSVAESIMDGFDTNKDNKISPKELLHRVGHHPDLAESFGGWQSGFLKADVDKDGHLDLKELASLLDHVSQQDRHTMVEESEISVAESIMDGFDINKDRKISLKELMMHVNDNPDVEAAFGGWQAGFLDADADKDGHLTVHELAGLLKNTVSPQDQHTLAQESMESIAGSIMDGLDADKDGKLSLMELVDHIGQDKQAQANWQGWEAGFKEADADKDGHLMLQELVVFVSHMSRQKQHDLVEESEKSIGDSILTGFDTNRDGKISLQELMDHVGDDKEVHAAFKGWQDGFKEADIDNDGFLSAEELTSLISHVSREDQHHMVEESEKSIGDSMLDAWDANKDGKISLKELMNRAGDKKEITAAFESGFRDSDANQDGLLDAKELTTLISHVSTKQQKKLADDSWSKTVSKLLEGYDLNKDGKVSLEEMKKHMERATAFQGAYEGWEIGFQEADADQDGHLSADELQYFFAHLSKSFQRSLISDEVKSFVKKFFLACDVDKNGRVTSKELMDQVSGKSEIQAFQEGWQNAFVETDTDKDGQLSVEEMASIFPRVTEQHRRKMFEESEVAAASVLAAFDTDKDGKLSVSELAGKVAGPTVQGFTGWQAGFKDADADRDGYLSAEEIAAWFKAISKPTAKHDEM
mmetsp:Transcript_114299/g.202584  ORF Transcript_114299/g.202584 Transcript_114299/m.202584 type:complete len:1151 (-) Transcript_114299:104-3556(-)